MAQGDSVDTSTNPEPETYTVTIEAIAPVAFAVPGIRKAATGDSITFENNTGGPIQLSTAAENVLEGIGMLHPETIDIGGSMTCKVEAPLGTYELSVHYSYPDKTKNNKLRTGFAIGASSPKIIVVPPRKRN